MKPLVPALPNGRVLFCDDIRGEVGNKTSLMGIYSGSMLFAPGTAFPIHVPKLGIAIFWHEPMTNYSPEVTFKVTFVSLDADAYEEGGTPLAESHLSFEEASKDDERALKDLTPEKLTTMSKQSAVYIVLSPFIIPHEGKIRVRAYRKSDVRMAGALRVEVVKTPDV